MPKRNKNYLLERKTENQARSIQQLSEALVIVEKKLDKANEIVKEVDELKAQIEELETDKLALHDKLEVQEMISNKWREKFKQEVNKTWWQKFKEGFKRG